MLTVHKIRLWLVVYFITLTNNANSGALVLRSNRHQNYYNKQRDAKAQHVSNKTTNEQRISTTTEIKLCLNMNRR